MIDKTSTVRGQGWQGFWQRKTMHKHRDERAWSDWKKEWKEKAHRMHEGEKWETQQWK